MSLIVEPQAPPLTTAPDGGMRVSGTRVPLETVVQAFYLGSTPEEIVQDFPTLTLAQVYAVLAYYLAHQDAVDAYVAERDDRREQARRSHEARFDPIGILARLLARAQQPPS